jgi:basic amino acid/polyamine antiporter, APA family
MVSSVRGPVLSLFDILCLGVNAIVGSGIYAFPGKLAAMLGPVSFLAFGLCGLVSSLIGLCFAEAASRFDRSGGPYIYAKASLGNLLGYLTGWTCWAAAILSWAAVARGLLPYLGHVFNVLAEAKAGLAAILALTLLLGLLNILGIKPGAWATNIFTIAKLSPLLLLVIVGPFFRRKELTSPIAPRGFSSLPRAAFMTFFAFQGFEVVPVPAGDTANPRRNAPIAVLGSLFASTLLYMAIQWIAVTTTPSLPHANQPLAEVGQALLGEWGGQLIAFGAMISMIGFCAGVALTAPRYLEALALDGFLPSKIAVRSRKFATPHLAIAITTAMTASLIVALDFSSLVDLSVLTVGIQYIATCLSVPLLRRSQPDLPSGIRLWGGPLIPIVSLGLSLWLSSKAPLLEVAHLGIVILLGLLTLGLFRCARRALRGDS